MFRRSVIARLLTPLVLMIALVVSVIVIAGSVRGRISDGHIAVEQRQRTTLELSELRSLSRSLQRDALNLVWEADAPARREIGERFTRRHREFAARLDAFARTVEGRAQPAYVNSQRQVLVELERVHRLAETNRTAAWRLFRTRVRPVERAASTTADALIDRSLSEGDKLAAQAIRTARRLDWQLPLLAACLSLVAVGAAVAIVLLTILRPLNDIGHAMGRLAQGDADTDIPHRARPDVIGAMARAIEVFRQAARERDALRSASEQARLAEAERIGLARAEKERREALEQQRRDMLGDLAGAIEGSLAAVNDKLRASAERLTRSADGVASHADDAGEQARATAGAAEGATCELASVAATSGQLAHSVASLNERTTTAAEAVRLAAARSRIAASRITQLGDWAEQVGELTGLIGEIARVSRQLAINATIEASRAVDGASFAVVAAEMKTLASRTSDATARVSEHVAAIRAVGRDAGVAVAEIDEAITQIERDAGFIAEAIAEQSAASREIGESMRLALANVEQVSARMVELGRNAGSTGALAGVLRADADVLAHDAADVDVALRTLIEKVRRAA